MKENFEVNINNLTEEEKGNFLRLIKKSKTILEPIGKRWRGKWGDVYYAVTSEGHLIDDTENEGFNDEQSYRLGNYFKTEEEAKFAREKQYVYQKLKDYALEHNTEAIDWTNPYQHKWFIECNDEHNDNDLAYCWATDTSCINQIYFTSKKIARDAVEEVGKENIKHYLFGIED